MTLEVDSLFHSGPFPEFLRAISGSNSLEDDLVRFTRVVRSSDQLDWLIPVGAVADVLDIAAARLEQSAPPSMPEATEMSLTTAAAAAGAAPSEYLRMMAELIRPYMICRIPTYQEIPMNAWEVGRSFPNMAHFGHIWFELDESPSYAESVRAGIESERPDHQIPLALEIQRALLFFPTQEDLARNLFPEIYWGNRQSMEEILKELYVYIKNGPAALEQ